MVLSFIDTMFCFGFHGPLLPRLALEAQVRLDDEGHAGFAQAQVCLMEHAHDAVVTASVAAATTSLYARAGINLQETFRQATGA